MNTDNVNPEKFQDMIDIYNRINNYGRENGMTLEVSTPGFITYRMIVLEKHLSSPNTCHGGAIAGLMDSVLGTAALSLAFAEGNLVSTVEFKINIIKPAFLNEELIGEGKTESKGKSLIITSGEIYRKDSSDLVAKGLGTFNIFPFKKEALKHLFDL